MLNQSMREEEGWYDTCEASREDTNQEGSSESGGYTKRKQTSFGQCQVKYSKGRHRREDVRKKKENHAKDSDCVR